MIIKNAGHDPKLKYNEIKHDQHVLYCIKRHASEFYVFPVKKRKPRHYFVRKPEIANSTSLNEDFINATAKYGISFVLFYVVQSL